MNKNKIIFLFSLLYALTHITTNASEAAPLSPKSAAAAAAKAKEDAAWKVRLENYCKRLEQNNQKGPEEKVDFFPKKSSWTTGR